MILHLICFQPAWIVSIVFVQTKQKRYNQLNHPLLYLWIEKIDGHLYRQSNFLWMEFRWINHTLQGFNYNLIQLLYLDISSCSKIIHCIANQKIVILLPLWYHCINEWNRIRLQWECATDEVQRWWIILSLYFDRWTIQL